MRCVANTGMEVGTGEERVWGGKREAGEIQGSLTAKLPIGRAEMLSRQLVQSQSALIVLGRMMSNEAIMQIVNADSMRGVVVMHHRDYCII